METNVYDWQYHQQIKIAAAERQGIRDALYLAGFVCCINSDELSPGEVYLSISRKESSMVVAIVQTSAGEWHVKVGAQTIQGLGFLVDLLIKVQHS